MSLTEGSAIDMLRLEAQVHSAVSSVDDPEYPGISIVDLGLLESIHVEPDGSTVIGLIPPFPGRPALAIIADAVIAAVQAVADASTCTVYWLPSPPWHAALTRPAARSCPARKLPLALQIGQRSTTCPLCASKTVEQSMFGPSRCRSVHNCTGCGETVEVLRG